jgi:hypothetical protein
MSFQNQVEAVAEIGSKMYRENAELRARAESAEAERDRYRDALIACRESVWRSLDRFRMMSPTDESRQLSALLDTIDAAAKGQG